MVLRARPHLRVTTLLASSTAVASVSFGCGTDEGGARPQTLTIDAGAGRSGEAGSAGEAGSGGAGGSGHSGHTGSGGTAAPDATDEPAGPCGKEFEPCCGGQHGACESSATLSCNDASCVSCTSVPVPSAACHNMATWGTATASRTRAPDAAAASYGAELAIDADVCNVWASGDYAVNPDAGVAETWWQVDLGALRQISALTLWLAMTPAGAVALSVEHGTDGAGWHVAWSGTQPMSGHAPWIHSLPKPIAARYLRIRFLDSPSWISIREFAAFECPSS
jgi:hypothetical protein